MNRILKPILLAATILAAAGLGAVAAQAEPAAASRGAAQIERPQAADDTEAARDLFAGLSDAIPAQIAEFAEELLREGSKE